MSGVPKAYRIFEENGEVYLVREYIEGMSLAQMVLQKGGISEAEICRISRKICQTAEQFQNPDEPMIHRDIKPENILFYNNRLCLSDFGLVWTIQEDNHITGNLEAVGPARIRPPEMEYNIEKVKEDIDFQKVDAYLFVKTIWIILTGNRNGLEGNIIEQISGYI